MQNESYPRRNDRRSTPRRGSQQAGRIGRAKDKWSASFCRLHFAGSENVGSLLMARHSESSLKFKDVLGRYGFPLSNRLWRNPNDARNCGSAICGAL